jgi:hypothetical protein
MLKVYLGGEFIKGGICMTRAIVTPFVIKTRAIGRLTLVVIPILVVLGISIASIYGRRSSSSLTISDRYIGFDPVETFLGDLMWHEASAFELNFVNDGDTPIHIMSIVTTCDCTLIDEEEYRNLEVKARSNYIIEGILKTGNRAGNISKTIEIMTDSGIVYTAVLNANVIPTYYINATIVDFGDIDLGNSDASTQKTIQYSSNMTKICGVPETDQLWLKASYEPHGESVIDIVLQVNPTQMTYGGQCGHINIPLSDADHPWLTITALARGLYPVRPTPNHVFLRKGESSFIKFLDRNGRLVCPASCDNTNITMYEIKIIEDSGVTIKRKENAVANEDTTEVYMLLADGNKVKIKVTSID